MKVRVQLWSSRVHAFTAVPSHMTQRQVLPQYILSRSLYRFPFPPDCPYTNASDSANSFVDRLASPPIISLSPPLLSHSLLTYPLSNILNLISPLSFTPFSPLALSLILPSAPFATLLPSFYDGNSLPLHPYTCASLSFSMVVQLYAHPSQLPTTLTLAARFRDRPPFCWFGCACLEDIHHLFVHCPFFDDLRDEYTNTLISDSQRLLRDIVLTPPLVSHLERVRSSLFRDAPSWPLASSLFYLGLLPPLLPTTTPNPSLPPESHHVFTCLAHSWHTSAIRLAARIWGKVLQQHLSSTHDASSGASRTDMLHDLRRTLPHHLRQLLSA